MLERKTCHFSRKQNNIYETALFNAFVLFLGNSHSLENIKGFNKKTVISLGYFFS